MDRCDTEPEPMQTEESNQNIHDNNKYSDVDVDNTTQGERKRRLTKEEQRINIIKSGKSFIEVFMKLLKHASKQVARYYLELVLHSIFFFGHIYCPPISPDDFLPEGRYEQYKSKVPKPFNEYSTHLPCYTPYSILLEYMTEILIIDDPELFMEKLLTVNKSMWIVDDKENQPIVNDFAASVVTYCYVKDSIGGKVLKKAYGSSMSCKGKTERKIMIAISALHVWDRAISYAVSCAGNGPPITFPEQVHCKAYRFKKGGFKEIPPCTKCNKMFVVKFSPEHLAHKKREDWDYGNCAENESLSRLLQSHKEVRNEICIVGENGVKTNRETIENMFKEKYEDKIKRKVKQLLSPRKFKFPSGEWNFFTPS